MRRGSSTANSLPSGKNRERLALRPIFGKAVSKSAAIPGCSSNIPYGAEQGILLAEQGIKVPCSAENRDISRQKRRLGLGA
jgi:hypothetical protein